MKYLALLALAGCGGAPLSTAADSSTDAPDLWTGGDASGAGDSSTGEDLAHALDLAGVDLPMTCLPSGSCVDGPACGDACCPSGEWCDASGGAPTCRCGSNPSCTGGNICASPVFMQNHCGNICCGANGMPCPG